VVLATLHTHLARHNGATLAINGRSVVCLFDDFRGWDFAQNSVMPCDCGVQGVYVGSQEPRKRLKIDKVNLREVPASEIIKETYYRPAIDRERGTQLELVLSLPAASTVTLTYDFEKAILRYTEYPPDANRGFNVAPAVIRVLDKAHNTPIYIRSTSLLLQLPTPGPHLERQLVEPGC
jgi:hypothetical protein